MEHNEFLFKMGQKIRILRNQKKLSQESLAAKANGERGYISDIESGKANPSIIYLKQISDALECEVSDLFKFTI